MCIHVPVRVRPLPLQRTAPLRVNLFVRTRPWRSRLRHRKTPSRVCICTAMRAPLRARPLPLQQPALLRVILLPRTRPQQFRLHIPPQAVRSGWRFCAFPQHHPGTCLRPFSLLVYG
jgi:hypothetical protein